MSSDYLWDKSGKPDPEVEHLERVLGTLRSQRPAPALPLPADEPDPGASTPAARADLIPEIASRRFSWPHLSAAAGILAVVITGSWLIFRERPALEVVTLEGRPAVGRDRIQERGRLVLGEWLETDEDSRAKIMIGTIGEVNVEPKTRLRLLSARTAEHRIALLRGMLHAAIWAPPRVFTVETPSATAVDLGCTYTLEVDDSGASLLHVTSGWVAFEFNGRESFVPEGGLCQTRPGIGPGTPHYEDALEPLQAALEKMDFEPGTPEEKDAALGIVLDQCRKKDAFTLWHLLLRVNEEQRSRVFDRLSVLAPPPVGVTREGILAADRDMLDRWWDSLGLESATWYRLWKGNFAPK